MTTLTRHPVAAAPATPTAGRPMPRRALQGAAASWLLIHRAPVGFDPQTFSGPFLVFLSFAQTLLPLALLQLYFRAQRSPHPGVQGAAAAGLAVLTLATAAGTATAYLMLWRPVL